MTETLSSPTPRVLATATSGSAAQPGPLASAWRRFGRNRLAVAGLAIVLAEFGVAAFGPALLGRDPIAQAAPRLLPPSLEYPMGTDDLGRDILARIVGGTGISLAEGLSVALLSMAIGTPIGALAAYYGRLDNPIIRPTEALMSIPGLLLALSLVPILGATLLGGVVAASLSAVPATIVFTRTLVLGLKPNDYVLAARAIGCLDARIIARHIVPNASSALAVSATFRVALGILIVSGLSFLGLGAQPPTPEWGAMLASGKDYLYTAPHVAAFPGAALALTILAYNMLGDGLRDVLDPRSARAR